MTSPERYKKAEELFAQALPLTQAQRKAFLTSACISDPELRADVESLLEAHEQPGKFIDTPPIKTAAEALKEVDPSAGRMIGHYRIINLIGRGGMGEVYLAQDTRLDRRVALKLLPAHFTSDSNRVLRFIQEAKAASALNHPNILTIHEIGEQEGIHFIATEYIEGQTLRQIMEGSPQKLRDVLDIAIQVAGALTAAHKRGIVHRDAKPENIMIRPDGLVKVLDFGLAKLVGPRDTRGGSRPLPKPQVKTAPGLILGTLQYMSPEQADGQPIDSRTDIFALGVVLYELLAGRAPFEGDNPIVLIESILNAEPAPIAKWRKDAPPELQRIIDKALRKNKEDRYQDCKEMLEDLKNLKQDLEINEKLSSGPNQAMPAQRTLVTNISNAGSMKTSPAVKPSDRKLLVGVALIMIVAATIIATILLWLVK
jgi:serine/threonine protein kinase